MIEIPPEKVFMALEALTPGNEFTVKPLALADMLGGLKAQILYQIKVLAESNRAQGNERFKRWGVWWCQIEYKRLHQTRFRDISLRALKVNLGELIELGIVVKHEETETQTQGGKPPITRNWYAVNPWAFAAFRLCWQSMGEPNPSSRKGKADYDDFIAQWMEQAATLCTTDKMAEMIANHPGTEVIPNHGNQGENGFGIIWAHIYIIYKQYQGLGDSFQDEEMPRPEASRKGSGGPKPSEDHDSFLKEAAAVYSYSWRNHRGKKSNKVAQSIDEAISLDLDSLGTTSRSGEANAKQFWNNAGRQAVKNGDLTVEQLLVGVRIWVLYKGLSAAFRKSGSATMVNWIIDYHNGKTELSRKQGQPRNTALPQADAEAVYHIATSDPFEEDGDGANS